MDPHAFDDFIKAQGIEFVHWKAMRCPIGIIDKDEFRRPEGHEGHENCSNGFMYTNAGTVIGYMSGNNKLAELVDIGLLYGDSAQLNIPRTYEGTEDFIYIAPFDRLYLKDESIVVPTWHLVEHNPSGYDRLKFPVVEVQDIVDNRGVRYSRQDFSIKDGMIHWDGKDNPGIDPDYNRGRVYAIRYLYRPYFYVKYLLHEIRVARVKDHYSDAPDHLERFPQSMIIQREYVFETADRKTDGSNTTDLRAVEAPPDGSFGPR